METGRDVSVLLSAFFQPDGGSNSIADGLADCLAVAGSDVYVCLCLYTYIHTYIRTYIHTYIDTYIHTYMHGTSAAYHSLPRATVGRLRSDALRINAARDRTSQRYKG